MTFFINYRRLRRNRDVLRFCVTELAVKLRSLESANFPTLSMSIVLASLLALPAHATSSDTPKQNWHSVSEIRATATNFVKAKAAIPGQRTTVNAGAIDDRLKLHPCNVALEAFLPPGSKLNKNTTVGVRCTSPRKWKLFVPVRIGVAAHVYVASKPLAAGTVLDQMDVLVMERDLAAMPRGYIRAGDSVAGLVLKRRVAEGEPLRNELLTAPDIVRRGQSLTIRSGNENSPVRIRMAGTALSDGHLGQRIRVKNRSSGRTIEGIVRSSELVEIGY